VIAVNKTTDMKLSSLIEFITQTEELKQHLVFEVGKCLQLFCGPRENYNESQIVKDEETL
jgi:hypothetical protein